MAAATTDMAHATPGKQDKPAEYLPKQKSAKPNNNNRSTKEIYARPLPLQIHPLPALTPHNPLSLLHIVCVLLSELFWPPSSHDSLSTGLAQDPLAKSTQDIQTLWGLDRRKHGTFIAYYDVHTLSVHVTDERATRALWEQGFFGKGSLSRSEPEWLARQEPKRRKSGSTVTDFLEIFWGNGSSSPTPASNKIDPDSPLGLNGDALTAYMADRLLRAQLFKANRGNSKQYKNGYGQTSAEITNKRREERKEEKRLRAKREAEAIEEQLRVEREELRLEATGLRAQDVVENALDLTPEGSLSPLRSNELKPYPDCPHGVLKSPDRISRSNSVIVDGPDGDGGPISRTHSVRFSTQVETIPRDIIERAVAEETCSSSPVDDPVAILIDRSINPPGTHSPSSPEQHENQEHLQLSLEETFFLVYALGILTVISPETDAPMSVRALLNLFRRISYYPPLPAPQDLLSPSQTVQPDDPFLLSYVVYHHFRSHGWVVRPGEKFAVDFLLYNRGPVFSHAEFAVLLMPSYSHPYWSSNEQIREATKKKQTKDWWWLHCANRVQNQVRKSLVLVYVDVPPPKHPLGTYAAQPDEDLDVGALLGSYKVREFVVGRWSMNRNRD